MELTSEKPSAQAPEGIEFGASEWAHEAIRSAFAKGFIPKEIQNTYINAIARSEFCRMAVMWLEYRPDKVIDTIVLEKGGPVKNET